MRSGAAVEGYLKIGGKTLVSGAAELGCTASMLLTLSCSGLKVRVAQNPDFLHKLHNYPAKSTSEAQTPTQDKFQLRQVFKPIIHSHR